MKKSFDKKAIKSQDIEAEGTLQSLLWGSSYQGHILPEGPDTPSYELAAEEELNFGGR